MLGEGWIVSGLCFGFAGYVWESRGSVFQSNETHVRHTEERIYERLQLRVCKIVN